MSKKVLFPNAIDYVQEINDNVVENLLAGRNAFVLLPSLYELAYAVVYETGEIPTRKRVRAPDETATTQTGVEITTLDV